MDDGWAVPTPESLGFEPRQLSAIGDAVRHGRLRNLHGVVIVRRGRLVFEQYFSGRDERWGAPPGEVAFGPQTLHDVRSVTKSVVGLLYRRCAIVSDAGHQRGDPAARGHVFEHVGGRAR